MALTQPFDEYLASLSDAAGAVDTLVALGEDGNVKGATPGVRTLTVPDDAVNASKFYENITITNPTGASGYAVRYAANVHTGQRTDAHNEITDALIARYSDVTAGPAWLRWNVMTSPLNEGSGLPGAPTDAQNFYMVVGEDNPQNRHSSPAWQRETRLLSKSVGGWHMAAETQDFSSALGDERVGYNISFGYVISRSPYSDTILNRHAKFNTGYQIIPNSIAASGYGNFNFGYRPFIVAVAIAAAGSGYTDGDIVTLASGLNQNNNEDAQVRVISVNGSGGITGIDLFNAGSFTTNPSATLNGSGGTGTGAQFTWTMATESSERPLAAYGAGGKWTYGLLFAEFGGNSIHSLTTSSGFTILMNNNEAIGARNAANAADVPIAKINASDQLELGGKVVLPWANFSPTIDGDASTAFTSSMVNTAAYARINDTVFFQITFTITTKGAATFINVTPPVATTGAILVEGRNVTTGVMLSGYQAGGGTKIRFATYAAGDPAADATGYMFKGMYRVQ
jgi:hypothetical protein